MFFRSLGTHLQVHTVSQPRIQSLNNHTAAVFYVEQLLGHLTPPPSSGRKPTRLSPMDRASPYLS
jgi:hypothetical protein